MPRMRILASFEQQDFDSPPTFDHAQRVQYFDLPEAARHFAGKLRTPTSRICFILSSAYFQATRQFFLPDTFHAKDLNYACKRFGVRDGVDPAACRYETRARHRQAILRIYGFTPFDESAKRYLAPEIDAMVQSELKPRLILSRTVDLLTNRQIEVPTYHALAQLILNAIDRRRESLARAMGQSLNADTRCLLDELLSKPDDAGPPSPTAAYRLTLLKKLSQSTRPTKVKERIADLERLREPFKQVLPSLDAIGLSHDSVRYYANSVLRSQIFQVSRRSAPDRYLHLVAFIAHQYHRLQDNLVDVLLSVTQTGVNSARREHKEQVYENRLRRGESLREAMACLDEDLLSLLDRIERILGDSDATDADRIRQIREIIRSKKDQRHRLEQAARLLRQDLDEALSGAEYHRVLETKSLRIQNRLTPIVRALEFKAGPAAARLKAAIDYFKGAERALDRRAPMAFLDKDQESAVTEGGGFRMSLYKVFLFIHIASALKSGTLNLEHSHKYRALDDYLIPRERWTAHREMLLRRADLAQFADPKRTLESLRQVLRDQYEQTNERLVSEANPHVTLARDGSLRIRTPPQDQIAVESLQSFFPERRYVSLLEVLATVNRYSGFLDELQHWQHRHQRQRPPTKTFLAGAIALGCQIGIRKIARISREINEAQLENTVNWYFTVDNIRAANDRILRLVDRLELPNAYRSDPDRLHTASDGQKFEVHGESLNASRSFKYFGKEQGSSVYSFIDERHLLFYSTVISAAERESAYVIDGLMHNDVVQSDIHSTDTHGYSEIVFGVMHLLGMSYAPRIKNLKQQRLYGFKPDGRMSLDWWLRPARYINRPLLESEWDDVLRFVATINLKEATASELFRRLNSYSKQHTLYRALKAFGQIIKSIFILRYIDDVELRQAVERQLNKIESSHRLARAILVGSPREIAQIEKDEQDVAEGCSRLIKNAITCWNYLYLAQRVAAAEPEAQEVILAAMRHGSVVSWRHINLLGEYDFSEERLRDSVGIKPPRLLT